MSKHVLLHPSQSRHYRPLLIGQIIVRRLHTYVLSQYSQSLINTAYNDNIALDDDEGEVIHPNLNYFSYSFTDEDPISRHEISPNMTGKYTLLRERSASPDGSVASVRRSTLGASAGPVMSPPLSSSAVAPFYSRPSVSPMPSPACSPLPHLSPQSPTPLSSLSSSSRVSSPQLIHATSTPVPDIGPSTQEVQQILQETPSYHGDSPIPDSVDEEMSVSRLVTEAFQSLGGSPLESQPPSPGGGIQSPPFLLDSLLDSPGSVKEVQASTPATKKDLMAFKVTSGKSSAFKTNSFRPIGGAATQQGTASKSSVPKIPPPIPTSLTTFGQKTAATKPTVYTLTESASMASSSKLSALKTPPSPIYISSRSLSPISDLTPEPDSDDSSKVIPSKKAKTERKMGGSRPTQPPKKRGLVLRGNSPGKQSAATTRVKKRKGKAPEDVDAEPPLKRARQLATKMAVGKVSPKKGKGKEKAKAPSVSLSASTSSSKEKEKKRTSSASVPGYRWPAKIQSGAHGFNQKVCMLSSTLSS